MQPCDYQSIGNKQTTLQFQPGYALHVKEENADVDFWADVNLQNPGFATTFKLPPGTVNMKVEGGKIAKLALKPDLKNFMSNLEIFPLENGAFNFSICNNIEKIKSDVKLEYNSAISQGKVTVSPKFEYKGVKIDGQFSFNGIHPEQPPVLVDHCKAYIKNVALCSCYNLKEKESRAAVFVDLKKAYAGTLLHLNKEFHFNEIDVFAKTECHGVKVGLVAALMAKKYSLNLESKCEKTGAESGARVTYSNKQIDFAAGMQTPIKCLNLQVVAQGKYAEKLDTGIKAQVKFPIKSIGEATAGINLANIFAPSQFGYNFEIVFKQ